MEQQPKTTQPSPWRAADCETLYSIPITKLVPPKEGYIPVIFLFNGTFCPIHKGHIDCLEVAKKFVHDNLKNHEVIGGYISPCWSGYSYRKLGINRLGTRHRVIMCELAVEQSDWLMVSHFETMQTHFIHIMENLDFLRAQLNQVDFLRDKQFIIAHIGGLDTGASRTPNIPKDVISLNIRNRVGFDEQLKKKKQMQEALPGQFYLVESDSLMDISSTKLRKCALNGESLDEFFDQKSMKKVADYIQKYYLWGKKSWVNGNVPIEMDMNPQQLTNLFQSNGYEHFKIHSSQSQIIGVKKGWRSLCYRYFNIQYSSSKTSSPEIAAQTELALTNDQKDEHQKPTKDQLENNNFILKTKQKQSVLPTLPSDFDSFVLKKNLNKPENSFYFENEIRFYQEISPSLRSIGHPKCYFTQLHHFTTSNETEASLGMEDLTNNFVSFSFLKGVPEIELLVTIKSIAEFHADFWVSEQLYGTKDQFSWIVKINDPKVVKVAVGKFKNGLKFANECFLEFFSKKSWFFLHQLHENLALVTNSLYDKSMCLTLAHGDFFINNIMFHKETCSLSKDQILEAFFDPSRYIKVLDWQTLSKGSGLVDLSTILLCARLSPQKEEFALRLYFDTTRQFGVDWKDYGQFYQEYQRAMLWTIATTFPFLQAQFSSNEKDLMKYLTTLFDEYSDLEVINQLRIMNGKERIEPPKDCTLM